MRTRAQRSSTVLVLVAASLASGARAAKPSVEPCTVARSLESERVNTTQLETAHLDAIRARTTAQVTDQKNVEAAAKAQQEATDFETSTLKPAQDDQKKLEADLAQAQAQPDDTAGAKTLAVAAKQNAVNSAKEKVTGLESLLEGKRKAATEAKASADSYRTRTLEPAQKAEQSAKTRRYAAVDGLLDDVRERGVTANKCDDPNAWRGLSDTALANMGSWNRSTTALKQSLRGQMGDKAGPPLANPIDSLFGDGRPVAAQDAAARAGDGRLGRIAALGPMTAAAMKSVGGVIADSVGMTWATFGASAAPFVQDVARLMGNR